MKIIVKLLDVLMLEVFWDKRVSTLNELMSEESRLYSALIEPRNNYFLLQR